jgi:hypothetical protein
MLRCVRTGGTSIGQDYSAVVSAEPSHPVAGLHRSRTDCATNSQLGPAAGAALPNCDDQRPRLSSGWWHCWQRPEAALTERCDPRTVQWSTHANDRQRFAERGGNGA